mgnify:CR=1 FL=1
MTNSDTQVEGPAAEVGGSSAQDLASLVDFGAAEPGVQAADDVVSGEEDAPASLAPQPVVEEEPEPVAETSKPSFRPKDFSALTSELPEIDELKHDGFYEDLTAEHIEELPTVAKRMLHNFRVAYEKNRKEYESAITKKDEEVSSRQSKLNEMERDFARRQAEFYALIDDPKVKETLQTPEGELPDPMTAEGIQARINKGVAEGLTRVLNPLHEAAETRMRESAYLDFVEKHPEMRDKTFKGEVIKLVRGRKEVGAPVSTQDAYQIVKARQVLAHQQARKAQEQRARAQASRRVSRATASGSPGDEGIPANVKRRGAVAIAQWLKNNPEAARKIGSDFRT